MKLVRHGDWPIGHSAETLEMLFHDLPVNSEVAVLIGTAELSGALSYCQKTAIQHTDQLNFISSPQ
jgi:hypothetical protein